MSKSDPLASALDMVAEPKGGGTGLKVEALFGKRPGVLDSIIRARRDRQLSFQQIADALSAEGKAISPGAVQKWLVTKGVR